MLSLHVIIMLQLCIFSPLYITAGTRIQGDPLTDVVILDKDTLSITCSYQGLPAPGITWSGDKVERFTYSVTSEEVEGDDPVREYVTTSVLGWKEEADRRGSSGELICHGSNPHDTRQQRMDIEVQCEYGFLYHMYYSSKNIIDFILFIWQQIDSSGQPVLSISDYPVYAGDDVMMTCVLANGDGNPPVTSFSWFHNS